MRQDAPGQIELTLIAPPVEVPEATVRDVELVVGILREKGQQTAAQIAVAMGWEPTENKKRKVRAIARAARPGIVSFSGSAGYKLFKDCTVEEINACLAMLDYTIRDYTLTKKLMQDALYSRTGGQS